MDRTHKQSLLQSHTCAPAPQLTSITKFISVLYHIILHINICFAQNQSPLTVSSVKASSSSSNNKDGGKDSNKDMADRLDMPPPPSPASSTCSDTSTSHSKY